MIAWEYGKTAPAEAHERKQSRFEKNQLKDIWVVGMAEHSRGPWESHSEACERQSGCEYFILKHIKSENWFATQAFTMPALMQYLISPPSPSCKSLLFLKSMHNANQWLIVTYAVCPSPLYHTCSVIGTTRIVLSLLDVDFLPLSCDLITCSKLIKVSRLRLILTL